jgi:hypothetical protein
MLPVMNRVQLSHLFADCILRFLNHCFLCVLPGVLHVHCFFSASVIPSSRPRRLRGLYCFFRTVLLPVPPHVLERPSVCLECFFRTPVPLFVGMSSTVAAERRPLRKLQEDHAP